MTDVTLAEVMRCIPHRPPFLMIDRCERFDAGKRITGIKCVSANEWYFGLGGSAEAIFPSPLLLEAIGQTGGVLLAKSLGVEAADRTVVFTSLSNVRFLRFARPGDVIRIPVELVSVRGTLFRFHADALVAGKLLAECDVTGSVLSSS